jgi:peptide/nickel transport system permease protein
MRYLLRRIGFYLIALWASVTLNFLIPRLAPGNPAEILIARFQGRIQPQALQALELQFGITNQPLWQQYLTYLNNTLHGNLGLSITYFPSPVTTMLAQELPWTLGLTFISLLISFILGTFLGALIAWRRGTFLDSLLPPVFSFISAIPQFFLALVLLYVLGFMMGLFPLHGGYDNFVTIGLNPDFIGNVLYHSILPAVTIVVVYLSGWMLGMRHGMVTTLSEDYVLMAQAKGLPESQVMLRYAARNALLPNITGFALSLGFVVSGQLLIEIVFSYPGIGFALLQAVQNSDYALMQGIFLCITIVMLIANFLVDLIYVVLDPRVRQTRS